VFVNWRPATFAAVFVSTTVISRTACWPAGMSIPFTGSSITRLVALPVFTGVHEPGPEIFVTLTNWRSAADAVRSSRMRTS
jgi:hypothetical protein